jgi:protoporphyrinogen oxidase
LKKIIVENGRVRAAIVKRDTDEIEIECDFYISTIPLPVLAECFSESAPADVLEAGRNLHYRAISLIGMLVAKCQVRPAYFTYFPKLSFNRLSEPINHGLKVKQEGHTLLIAETVCAHGDSAWKGEKAFCQAVVDDIVSESLLRKEDIAEIHPYAWRYAYPIYTIGFRRNVDKVLSFLQSLHNIHSTGRHGEFNYVNMHVAMQMGIASLDKVKAYAGDTIKKCTAK